MPTLIERVPPGADDDAVYTGFAEWASDRGLPLYPAQDEAVIELVSGANVVLSTPTGTGKSLVAVAAHTACLARGGRTWYTAPIKALVSEKFFALVEIFGAANVGMDTGSKRPSWPRVSSAVGALDAPVGLSCGGGTAASHHALALATLGIEAPVHVDSWSGWVKDPARPVETGSAP